MTAYTFDQLIDFTRASAGTFVNSAGNIVSTPASRNLLTFTQQFDNAAWTRLQASVTANAEASPDGTTTADRLIADASNASHQATQSVTTTATATTYSVYAKPSGYNWVALGITDGGSTARVAYFNISTGVVGTVAAGITASITPAGNGWYRCVATVATALAGTNPCRIYVTNADNILVFTGDGTSGIYLWGAQLELGTTATDYTRNVGGLFPPRFDYDPVTRAPRGLLVEEQRTNLLTFSEEFDNAVWGKSNVTITANAAVSPDGTMDADKVEATASTNTLANRSVTGFAGTAATFSIYAKRGSGDTDANKFGIRNSTTATNLVLGSVDYATGVWTYSTGSTGVIVTDAGNGWWRIQISASSGITSGDTLVVYYGFTGFAETAGEFAYTWGAQLEAGSFATSYIPTTSAQVTRSADVATITGANFSQFYNQSEGTFVVEADSVVANTTAVLYVPVAASDGTGNNLSRVFIYNGKWGGSVRVAGVDQADLQQSSSFATNVPAKIALAYAANNFAVSVNGNTALTDTSGSLPTVNQLAIGHVISSNYLNGHIRSIRYYPARLSNATLQSLTA